jgi:hypothetical protein
MNEIFDLHNIFKKNEFTNYKNLLFGEVLLKKESILSLENHNNHETSI